MKQIFFLFITLIFFWTNAQNTNDSTIVDTTIVLQYEDELPEFTIFSADKNQNINRSSSFIQQSNYKSYVFIFFVLYSILLCLIYIKSKDVVKASLKSLFNFQYALQYYRTQKERNVLYYFFYLLFFIISFSYFLQNIFIKHTNFSTNLYRIIIVVSLFFIIDYFSSFIYLLFTKKSKSVNNIQKAILSYAVVFCIYLWPLMAFVIVGDEKVQFYTAIIGWIFLAIILILKELRVLQILLNDKIDIVSFHFFTYLCTFKFLPIIILVKVLLT